ncbi:MAG: hypothetical protein QME32_05875, partial [Endomicrobiia bacterium]|nr:hypothetical protein [Endomicrobiia bacterium]
VILKIRRSYFIMKDSMSIYGMGFIGAAIFFIRHASGFWWGALGLVKALFWPAFMVYKALELLYK